MRRRALAIQIELSLEEIKTLKESLLPKMVVAGTPSEAQKTALKKLSLAGVRLSKGA